MTQSGGEHHLGTGYLPLDLAGVCDAGAEVLEGIRPFAGGSRTLHGLPFLVGGDGTAARMVLIQPAGSDKMVEVGRRAPTVIVAHRRLPGTDDSEPATGEVVAQYVFTSQGGRSVAVPIRERFEIGVFLREGWDQESPFLAVGAGPSQPLDRYEGKWGDAGFRQTETPHGEAIDELFLWVWENPEPETVLESIRLEPRGWKVVVAAITTGETAEHPFVRQAALPVRIDLPGRSEGIEVTVDRGVAAYTFPLPGGEVDDFMADPLKGWGDPADAESNSVYTRIAALPSATLTVAGPEGVGARVRWSDVIAGDAVDTEGVRIELAEQGRNWVHVRVVDDETSRPVPCRVHFRSPQGIPYQPHGHHDHVNSDLDTWHIDVGGDLRLGHLTYAYIDGTCQGWLPVGEVIVDAARGFEYEPLRERIRIERGQRELTLRLRRWTSMNRKGWYSGDSHVHFLSSQGALTEQQGEDLNVVNLLQSQWGSLFTNTEDFTGRPLASPDGRYVTFVGQENRQHFLGHLALWGLREPVMPWCTDGPVEAEIGGPLEATESDWADQSHDRGGTVVIAHFPWPNGEPAVLIANGRADAVEMIVQRPRAHREYYSYLNCGYRLPLVGGTDKMSSDVPVGLYRTYARLGAEEFSYDGWRAAVTAGRTFLSSGPLLDFTVDGHDIGETIILRGRGSVTVSAVAESIFPVATLEVVKNGEVIAAATEDGGSHRLELTAEVPIEEDSWLAARSGGPGYFDGPSHRDAWGRNIFAHTSPVYVTTAGEWSMFDPVHARYMLTLVEGGLEYVRRRAAADSVREVTHHHGEPDHLAYLERPFLEARAEIGRRLGEAGDTA